MHWEPDSNIAKVGRNNPVGWLTETYIQCPQFGVYTFYERFQALILRKFNVRDCQTFDSKSKKHFINDASLGLPTFLKFHASIKEIGEVSFFSRVCCILYAWTVKTSRRFSYSNWSESIFLFRTIRVQKSRAGYSYQPRHYIDNYARVYI